MAETVIDRLIDDAPFTKAHRKVWLLSSMGIMLDGFDFFIVGVAIPLIKAQWHPGTLSLGLIGSAAILGAIVGASTLGVLTDKIGRRLAFRLDLVMFVVFALASALAPSITWLIVFRFLLGIGIGADYPISSAYVAEVIPSRDRTKLLVGAFSFQAVGQLLGVLVGVALLEVYPSVNAWRPMLAFGVIPALFIVWLRRQVPDSPKWLAARGRLHECADALSVFLDRPIPVDEIVALEAQQGAQTPIAEVGIHGTEEAAPPTDQPRWRELFNPRWRRATVLTTAPWFFMDIATYGVGVFTPTIIAVVLTSHSGTASSVATTITSTKGAAFVDLFLVAGFVLAIWLITKVGKVRLQIVGFVAMAMGLAVLAYASHLPGGGDHNIVLVLVGFALFNLFMNMGPNTTTFAMPAEIFETRLRAAGSGLAASTGKAGAALGALLFPTLQSDLGLPGTLLLIAGGCFVAALITYLLRGSAGETFGGWRWRSSGGDTQLVEATSTG